MADRRARQVRFVVVGSWPATGAYDAATPGRCASWPWTWASPGHPRRAAGVLGIFAALAENDRERLRQRAKAGIPLAKT